MAEPQPALCIDGPLRGQVFRIAGRELLCAASVYAHMGYVPPTGPADEPLVYRLARWTLGGHRTLRLLTCQPAGREPSPDDMWDVLLSAGARECEDVPGE